MNDGSKLLEKMTQRLAAAGFAGRNDLTVVDVEPFQGNHAGRVLMAFDSQAGAPDARQVERWFESTFGNAVRPDMATARCYEAESLLSVVASLQVLTRPITDADNREAMARLTPLNYVDLATKDIWDVVKSEDGSMHMRRQSSENFTDMVEARKARLRRETPRLAELARRYAGVLVESGDRVQYFDSNVISYGKVTGISGDKVTISGPGGGSVTVDRAAVLKVTEKSPSAMSKEKADLQAYFEQAYGDKAFAKDLTSTTATDAAGGKTGA